MAIGIGTRAPHPAKPAAAPTPPTGGSSPPAEQQ
jgi:hypothetical protein